MRPIKLWWWLLALLLVLLVWCKWGWLPYGVWPLLTLLALLLVMMMRPLGDAEPLVVQVLVRYCLLCQPCSSQLIIMLILRLAARASHVLCIDPGATFLHSTPASTAGGECLLARPGGLSLLSVLVLLVLLLLWRVWWLVLLMMWLMVAGMKAVVSGGPIHARVFGIAPLPRTICNMNGPVLGFLRVVQLMPLIPYGLLRRSWPVTAGCGPMLCYIMPRHTWLLLGWLQLLLHLSMLGDTMSAAAAYVICCALSVIIGSGCCAGAAGLLQHELPSLLTREKVGQPFYEAALLRVVCLPRGSALLLWCKVLFMLLL